MTKKRRPGFGMLTVDEMANIANAALDWYLTPDDLTPRERSRQRLREARRALRQAKADLEQAIAYRNEVRRMPFAERNKRWERTEKDKDPWGLGLKRVPGPADPGST